MVSVQPGPSDCSAKEEKRDDEEGRCRNRRSMGAVQEEAGTSGTHMSTSGITGHQTA